MDYAIMQQITTARTNDLKKIDTHDGDTLDKFSTEEMLRRVGEYHEDCSFTQAVTTIIQNAAGNDTKAAPSGDTNKATPPEKANKPAPPVKKAASKAKKLVPPPVTAGGQAVGPDALPAATEHPG
jgi:hypothetical protein